MERKIGDLLEFNCNTMLAVLEDWLLLIIEKYWEHWKLIGDEKLRLTSGHYNHLN